MATTWRGKVDESNVKERSRVSKKNPSVGMISPNPKAGPGWRASLRPIPADPKDVKRPTHVDIKKT